MNLLARELKCNLKSLIIWCLAMSFLIYAGMIKYSAFAKTGEAINSFMSSIPDTMRSVFGITTNMDLTSVGVFYSIFFLYFLLLASVHSAMLGALILAKEERDKTADFLFVKPLTRKYIISIKILAAFINILAFDVVTYIISIISVANYNTGKSLNYSIFLVVVALFIIQLLFLGLGLLLGAVAKNSKTATSIISAVILGVFVLKVIIDLQDKLKYLEIFSPFEYFKSDIVMFDHQINLPYTVFSFFLVILCTGLTYYFFGKRDLKN